MLSVSCNTGMDSELQDDLIIDCLNFDFRDENLLEKLITKETHVGCKDKNQLACLKGHQRCFNITEICKYKLNKYGHLTPRRTGGYIEECKEFECNMMFKCLGYYCIPWSYVYDGKWDCPEGSDELSTYSCGKTRKCKINAEKLKYVFTWGMYVMVTWIVL